MTMGDGPRTARPSEDVIRRRLIERRLDHEKNESAKSWRRRLTRPVSPAPAARAGDRRSMLDAAPASPLNRLRRRPVAAFATASVAAVALVAAGTAALSTFGADNAPTRVAGNQMAERSQDVASASRTQAGATPSVTSVATENTAAPATAERSARPASTSDDLRVSTGDLPATIPAQRLSSETVEAALALRLPPEAPGTTETLDPALTTSSIRRSVDERRDRMESQAAYRGATTGQEAGEGPAPDRVDATDTADEAMLEDVAAVPATDAPAAASAAAGSSTPSSATVTANVNMRAKPDNEATIVSVLSKGEAVELLECDMWCHVSADGKSGYVYKSFVDRQG